jgi:SAM-dependent methyltransferase
MHAEAYDFVKRMVDAHGPFERVVEFGGRNINGSVRDLFGKDYWAIDNTDGPGVDQVVCAAEFKAKKKYDAVVCCEVLEHTPRITEIVEAAHKACRKKGSVLITAACRPRAPHSSVDGGELREGEYYRNVSVTALREQLGDLFDEVYVETRPWGDVYVRAVK